MLNEIKPQMPVHPSIPLSTNFATRHHSTASIEFNFAEIELCALQQ